MQAMAPLSGFLSDVTRVKRVTVRLRDRNLEVRWYDCENQMHRSEEGVMYPIPRFCCLKSLLTRSIQENTKRQMDQGACVAEN